MGLCYEWSFSGICFGSTVIYHLQFYINDLDTGISSDVSKFEGDPKIGRVIKSDQDADVFQNELDSLYDWEEKWEMKFDLGKCSIMSVGRTNPTHNYCLMTLLCVRLGVRGI